jgi:hypothetical protein
MSNQARPRHYLAPTAVAVLRLLFRYSEGRDAYVLRLIGHSSGPVLKIDRRREQRALPGPDRRRAAGARRAAGSQPTFM